MVTELNILNLAFRPLSDEDDKEKIDLGEEDPADDGSGTPSDEDPDDEDDADGPETLE
jgi:hypothetical protein